MKTINNIISESGVTNFVNDFESGRISPEKEVVVRHGEVKTKGSMSPERFSKWQVYTHEGIKHCLRNTNLIDDITVEALQSNKKITARTIYNAIVQSYLSDDIPQSQEQAPIIIDNNQSSRGMETRKLSGPELEQLSLNNAFSPDIHYIINFNCTFINMPSNSSLPKNVTFQGDVSFVDFPKLSLLPTNMKVRGNLSIQNCQNLIKLPDSLDVRGKIEIRNCNSLVRSGAYDNTAKQMRANESLAYIRSHPPKPKPQWYDPISPAGFMGEDLERTLYDISVNNLSSYNPRKDSSKVAVRKKAILDVLNKGLSISSKIKNIHPAFFTEYHYTNINTLHKAYMVYEILGEEEGFPLPELKLIEEKLTNQEKVLMKEFLVKLLRSQDFKTSNVRPIMCKRVLNMFSMMLKSSVLAEQINAIVGVGDSSCDDRVLLSMSEIDVLAEAEEARIKSVKTNNPSALIEVARQRVCLDEINKIATEMSVTNEKTDEVAIVLALQLKLRARLRLPAKSQSMNFPHLAKELKPQDYEKAAKRIEKACTEEAINKHLEGFSAWQYFQRHLKLPSFESLGVEYVDQIRDCCINLERGDKMVSLSHEHVSYDALAEVYRVSGRNPFRSNVEIDWGSVKRLIKK